MQQSHNNSHVLTSFLFVFSRMVATRRYPNIPEAKVRLEDLLALGIKEALAKDKAKRKKIKPNNGWRHTDISAFQYYCCPECSHHSQHYKNFKEHALKKHSKVMKNQLF
jgi:hypothetical protein